MKIARLDLDEYTREDQFYKVREEFDEVVEAFSEKSDEDLVEELWDLIQAAFGLLFMILPSLKLFKASYTKHQCKIRTRNEEGRIKISENVDL
ncbi:unnamed protein product [marine sediment metagenome]|uniref:Uncharacterized protein n=1 Tax=marine sediment metagenome TaxID=412755 RepID=X1BM18_9ZZZZ